jgi:hypothetical protein
VLEVRRALKDILAGAIFIAFGLAFGLGALAYEVGDPLRMGPGYIPLALGILLAGLGVAVVVKGFLAGEGESIGGVDLRAIVLIVVALLFFGLTVRGLGVAVALFGTTLLASLARARTPLIEVLLISAGLTVLSVVLFIYVLQLRLPLTGPWLPF